MNRTIVGMLTVALFMGATLAGTAQDVANGKKVYTEYCKTCHQDNGKGMPKIYPPLAASDYIKAQSVETLIREVVFGKSGKVKVNGAEYNGVMAPLPKKYTDKDIADVMTYVFSSFGNSKGKVTPADVAKAKKKGKMK